MSIPLRRVDPAIAVASTLVLLVAAAYLAYTLSNASYTLGCDYLAYDHAARAWLAGRPIYDLTVATTGACGTFQYPPPFLVPVVPFTILPPAAATWAWIAVCALCVPLAILATPVPAPVRLVTLALAGTSWPVLFAIKVGALGPLLMLVFALSWRWMDRPGRLAAAAAFGAFAKVQPAVLLPWMALTSRWRAFALACAGLAVVGGAWLVFDARAWLDYLAVERAITGSAIQVPANLAPASIAYFRGVPAGAASAIGLAHTVAVLALVVLTARRLPAEPSILVAVVASQLVAPVLWDHYAVVIFLPVAWLLARRQWWVVVPALAVNAMFVAVFPPQAYVVLLDVVMVATAAVGWTERSGLRAPVPAATP